MIYSGIGFSFSSILHFFVVIVLDLKFVFAKEKVSKVQDGVQNGEDFGDVGVHALYCQWRRVELLQRSSCDSNFGGRRT